MKKRIKQFSPVAIVIDPAGPAAYLIPDLEKHLEVEVMKPIGREVAAACASLYVGVSSKDAEARDVRIRPHPSLDAAAKSAEWRDRGDARVFDRRADDQADASPLITVALAAAGFATAPRQAADPWVAFG